MDSTKVSTIGRRQNIVRKVVDLGSVQVADLVEIYNVSAVTIRYDLNYLHKKGLLVRTRGGAIAKNDITQELSIKDKYTENLNLKKKLGLAVAQLISDGESIILDSGTTTAEVANCLHDFEHLVVMTNGLNVAQNIMNMEGVEVLMTGGTLRKKSLSFYGSQAEASLAQYSFNKVVLGADGFDIEAGLTTFFEPECILNRAMCMVAKEVIVVTDSSKFNRSSVYKIRKLNEIDVLVTDSGISDAMVKSLKEQGVKLIIVD